MRFEAIARLDQSEITHLEKIIVILTCLLGVMSCDGTNQVQVVLNLLVPTPEAISVQRMHVNAFPALAVSGMPSHPCNHGIAGSL